MISILIVDDDLVKITSIINSILKNYKHQVDIRQALNVQEALEALKIKSYHLLITDLFMPLRIGEKETEKGGEILIKKIYRTKEVNVPIYIVGLTQFEHVRNNFSGVWQVWNFDISDSLWKDKMRDLVFHIAKVNSKIIDEKKETIFVEGSTDKIILELAIKLFNPWLLSLVSIETISFGGGSSWVERQLIIWGKSLSRKEQNKSKYLKAVGVFDNDEAGNISISSLNNQIRDDSAERKTFSIKKFSINYAKHLIPIYKKGVELPVTLEEMYSIECWQLANKKGWLEKRNLSEKLLKEPKKWDKINYSLKEYMDDLHIDNEVEIFLNYKLKDECKIKLANFLLQLQNQEDQKKFLIAFQKLIQDLIDCLNLSKST